MARKVAALKKKFEEPVEEIEEAEEEKPEPKSRLKKYKPTMKIRVLVDKNPKREGSGSYKRFERYTNGMTVQEALDEGITPADLDYDNKKEFIKITA